MGTTTTNTLWNIFNFAGSLWLAWDLLVLLYIVVVGFIIWFIYFYKKEKRLFKNLKRKVLFFTLPNSLFNLETELKLVSENGFFQSDTDVKQYSDSMISTIGEKTVIVLSYSPSFTGYKTLIDLLQTKKIPFIIFAKFDKVNRISDEHQAIFDQYPYHQICNGTSRLLASLFSICAVTPI